MVEILHRCEMCGKKVLHVQDHHIIPWYLSHDDSESNIMRLCVSCHRKADTSFDNLILRGKINVSRDTRKRVGDRYHKKYRISKTLYTVRLLKYIRYQDTLCYNIRTGHIAISHSWGYTPNKHISTNVTEYISTRRRLTKAASRKSQTTLAGGT